MGNDFSNGFSLLPMLLQRGAGVSEIIALNEETRRYGLALTPEQARELVQTRDRALRETGRVEFGGGLVSKLIEAFADSPYLNQRAYAETLNELVEAFYYFKNETLDELADDELIEAMRHGYNNTCHGSVELLTGRELEALARSIRFGGMEDEEEEDEECSEDGEEQAWE